MLFLGFEIIKLDKPSIKRSLPPRSFEIGPKILEGEGWGGLDLFLEFDEKKEENKV